MVAVFPKYEQYARDAGRSLPIAVLDMLDP
jgi:hypothetical protein